MAKLHEASKQYQAAREAIQKKLDQLERRQKELAQAKNDELSRRREKRKSDKRSGEPPKSTTTPNDSVQRTVDFSSDRASRRSG
jgi:hypothetical protein